MKKIILLLLLTTVMIITGCARIDSQVELNKDLSGTWVANLTSEVGPIPKTELEKELKKDHLENYKLEPVGEGSKQDQATQWKITTNFKNLEELKKIAHLALGNSNNSINIITDENKVTHVNLGHAYNGNLTLKVPGEIIKESLQSGSIDEKGNLVFQKGELVSFQYKQANNWFIILIGIAGLVILILIGTLYFKFKKKHKPTQE